MKKKMGPRIILAAFIVLICCPQFLWILFERYMDSENYENRELAMRPEFSLNSYDTYSGEYNDYFNDHLPFRNYLITLNSMIDYFVFDSYRSERAIVGKDNWFFYTDVNDGDPISCYQGTNLLSEEELQAIADNCIAQRDFLAEQGKELVIFIAPNKERVYYENMPEEYGLPANDYMALQVVEYLQDHTDIRVIYPYEELMEAKSVLSQNIYYKTDTHWNYVGGYIGAVALLREMGIEIPSITDEQIVISKDDIYFGDLMNMLGMPHLPMFADDEYLVTGYDDHNIEILEWEFHTVFSYHAQNADSRKLFVVRDSFSSAMVPYVASQFNDSHWRFVRSYTYEDFENYDPDIVVFEFVERNIRLLGTFSLLDSYEIQ